MKVFLCAKCGGEFTDDEWEGRHTPHGEVCTPWLGFCACDYNVHSYCCWNPECILKRVFDK